jgi:glycosyltransferase involved in cell wall biosynthesis
LNLSKKTDLTTHVANAKRLGYLSAAPRVSTRIDAKASGPRAHVLGVIRAFESLGWDVDPYIVGDRLPSSFTNRSEEKMERSALVRLGADIARLGMGLYHSVKAWRELCDNVDWVYERLATLQVLGWIFQKRGIPWILETSGLFFYEAKVERKSIFLSNLARMIELWAYRNCDVLVCVTDTLKELIVTNSKILPDKVLVVPNGVDTSFFDPDQHSPKRLFDGATLGFVGALINWHRLDILLYALAEMHNEGVHFNLTIVGDGPMQSKWETLAKEVELQESIRFVGQVPWNQVPSYIAGFDLGFIGNDKMEIGVMYHSPLKLYEYMSMALPVIASAYDDSQMMIEQGKNGYLFNPGDKDDLKRVLRDAFNDRYRWQEIGFAGRQKVLEQASWSARVQKMNSEIERVLKEQSCFRAKNMQAG